MRQDFPKNAQGFKRTHLVICLLSLVILALSSELLRTRQPIYFGETKERRTIEFESKELKEPQPTSTYTSPFYTGPRNPIEYKVGKKSRNLIETHRIKTEFKAKDEKIMS
jgi:hypothetical protein